jgi:hypothetical protein
MAWLDNFTSGLGTSAGQLGQMSPQLLLMALLGYAMDQSGQNTYGGNAYQNALTSIGNDKSNVNTMLQNAMSGQTQNPQVQTMRNALQTRATTGGLSPLTGTQIQNNPIAQNMPQRFNPYASGNYSTANPLLMQQLLSMATAGSGNAGNVNTLQNMLNSRMATRPMAG